MIDLSRQQWETLLDRAGEPATRGDLVEAIEAADMIESDGDRLIEAAIESGDLVEDPDAGMFGSVALPESDSPDENPGDEPSKDVEKRSLEAFAAAIEFFHRQLDRDIGNEFDLEGAEDGDTWIPPQTPREYYAERRGWEAETIEAKQLGYAPADDHALLDYLMRAGFDGDAIQGTGLFNEDFSPHFKGRYVLPYFDADARPVYAISRSLNENEGGHPRDSRGDQKYTKAIKTKERSYVDEPIYGRETIDDDTDRLLVAGGIADAITLHEAGYACISPVTTVRFKSKHEPTVVDLVEKHDLDGVYMLNDAERPTSDKTELAEGETADSISEVLTIKQYGEGQRAAFGNAEFLLEEDVDTYLVRLPGGDDSLRKLDPDDYLKENWGSVETLLRNARHAEHHAGYNDWLSRRQQREVAKAIRMGDRSGESSSSERSELYELEFPDVSNMDVGDRQNNPLGHHGDSEGYFVCAEKQGFKHGYDHKYNVAYNAVSFLLCDAGERRADDPNGQLSDWEVFVAWQHAKKKRLLLDDDPIPYRGILGVAVEDGLVDRDELVERDSETGEIVADDDRAVDTYTALPKGTYSDVLEHISEEYGVDPGRETRERETRSSYYDIDLAEYADGGDPWTDPDTMLRSCLRARDTGAVSDDADPPAMALLPLRRDVLGQPADRDMNTGTKELLEELYHELDGVADAEDVLAGE